MKILLICCLLQAFLVSAFQTDMQHTRNRNNTHVVPSKVTSGDVVVNTVSRHDGLDGPQLSAVNSSSYEWWYFDAISSDLQSSVTIVFSTALASGFDFFPESPVVTTVEITYSFPSGVNGSFTLNATQAVIATLGQGSFGVFEDSGAAWGGEPDLSSYTVDINAPHLGVSGNLTFKSTAPAHYPYGKAVAGQPMMFAPNIGWSNAIPDANAEVYLALDGKEYNFEGTGYHDHNWGGQPFQNNVLHEHWGRGRLGDYSIVWSTVMAPDSNNYATVYIAANDTILTANQRGFLLEEEYHDGDVTGPLTGYVLYVWLDSGLFFNIQVKIEQVVFDSAPWYMRWTGSLTGQLDNGETLRDGVAIFEMFDLSTPF